MFFFLYTKLFQKRGHYSRGDIIQRGTLFKEIRTWIWDIFKISARAVFEVIEFWDFDLHFFSLTKKTALNIWLLISLGCVPATKHQINKQCIPLECPIQVPCLIHLWSRFKTLQSTTVQSTCWASFARSGRYFHSSAYVCVNQGRRNWWPQG